MASYSPNFRAEFSAADDSSVRNAWARAAFCESNEMRAITALAPGPSTTSYGFPATGNSPQAIDVTKPCARQDTVGVSHFPVDGTWLTQQDFRRSAFLARSRGAAATVTAG